jgi:nucleotide-binding universal stress UspA family protein
VATLESQAVLNQERPARVAKARPEAGAASQGPRVVVGVDGSAAADQALVWAAEEARMRGAVLEIVHANFFRRELLRAFPGFARGERVILARAMARAKALAPTVKVVGRLCEPPPAEALAKESEGASLLVVGSRGLHGFEELAKGSVSNYCVHYAHCPVLVVPRPDRLEGGRRSVGAGTR